MTVWLGVAFSLAAGLFWLVSSCCCSGRSNRIKGYGDGAARSRYRDEQGPYQYERVESPLRGGGQKAGYQTGPGYQAPNVPLNDRGGPTAYEPFRHEDV